MSFMSHPHAFKDLQRIPGVGPSIAEDLYSLGIHAVADLRGQDAEALYARLCAQTGQKVDRCMLYVFRCAIYFADHENAATPPDPEKLRWWYWKDPS
jgi:3-methyladenine DNA glycosylase/8-oxoguanine DNA glycosylase